jgi:hypothetical protein
MKIHYHFARLSPNEREILRMVLLEEIEMQRWYAVRWSVLLGREEIIYLH